MNYILQETLKPEGLKSVKYAYISLGGISMCFAVAVS